MIQKLKISSDISLSRLARVALWLGIAGFGGGFAIVQQLRRIVVQRYQWVTAVTATFGMFAPPMLLSLAAGRSLEAFRANAMIRGALHGVTPAMVGLLGPAAVALCKTSIHDIWSAAIAVVATLVLVFACRTSPLIVLLAGGMATSAIVWLK
jgi:chromate transport protein ChrA